MSGFKIQSEYKPSGDQPKAIDALINGIEEQVTKTETTLKLGKDLADEDYV